MKLLWNCILGGLLSVSCNSNDATPIDAVAPLVVINGDTCIQKGVAVAARDGYTFSVELYSRKDNSKIDLVVYFEEPIRSVNNLSLSVSMVCLLKKHDYIQIPISGSKVTVSSVSDNSLNILFESCELGKDSYIAGNFSSNLIQYINLVTTINIWGARHPLNKWINGETYWNGNNLFNIQNTELIVYSPRKSDKPSPAVLICPGGAYTCLATVHEGSQVAQWFAEQGVTAAVLHYCMPNAHPEIPLSDAQEAMRYLRRECCNLKIDPHQIGVMGFSAGGHLASLLSTHFNIENGVDVVTPERANESRPDFTILCYPVIMMDGPYVHTGSRNNLLGTNPTDKLVNICSTEKQITVQTPPALIFYAKDDNAVPLQNSVSYYNGLVGKGIKSRFISFPTGNHGWGFNEDYACNADLKMHIMTWLCDEIFDKAK